VFPRQLTRKGGITKRSPPNRRSEAADYAPLIRPTLAALAWWAAAQGSVRRGRGDLEFRHNTGLHVLDKPATIDALQGVVGIRVRDNLVRRFINGKAFEIQVSSFPRTSYLIRKAGV